MPGHVKLGKSGEPDPDPSPYLTVSMEMKREDMLKPYDPKKSVWVPTDDHGFREGLLESDDGKKAVVMCGHEVRNIFSLAHNINTRINNQIKLHQYSRSSLMRSLGYRVKLITLTE
jgi:hypothetical protein